MSASQRSPFVWTLPLLLLAPLAYAGPSAGEVRRALKSGDRARITETLTSLRGSLEKNSLKAILGEAPRLKTLGVYDDLVATLATAEGDALEELIKQAKRSRQGDVRFLAVDALGQIADAGAEKALAKVLEEDRDETVAVQAARLLGRRGTKSAVDLLIPLLKDFEADSGRIRLAREINGALSNLTGQDISVAEDWRNYWDSNQGEFSGAGLQVADSTRERDQSAMDRMRRERPSETRTMERLGEDDVVVIKGRSDKVERILKGLEIAHKEYERSAFDSVELDPARQVLVLNCASKESLSEEGIQRVRAFVAQGGYVFSSDWELKHTLEKAFPEVCGMLKDAGPDGLKVAIRPVAEHANHPLLRDVFPLSSWVESSFTWQIDKRSHLVRPNPALTVLVESPDMESHGSTIVAFTFGFTKEGGGRPVTGGAARRPSTGSRRGRTSSGPGQVLHVMSHFKNQKDASGDGFALQQLLLNFILEKQEARRQAAAN